MKKFFTFVFLLLILGGVYFYRSDITDNVLQRIARSQAKNKIAISEYANNYQFQALSKTDDFYVSNINEVYNAIYTIIDNGWSTYSLYCNKDYENCIKDITNLTGDDKNIELINNLVHPYNSFDNIQIKTFNFGVAKIEIIRAYSDDEITKIDNEIDRISNEILTDNMTTADKIKAFHDYVVNNTTYDTEESIKLENNIFSKVKSNKANTVLFDHLGLCGGYSDTMSIFLHKLGVKNYKISSTSHVWNYMLLDNIGYHIDVTWDDPVIAGGEEILDHTFFMLTDEQLAKADPTKHNYDKDLYK